MGAPSGPRKAAPSRRIHRTSRKWRTAKSTRSRIGNNIDRASPVLPRRTPPVVRYFCPMTGKWVSLSSATFGTSLHTRRPSSSDGKRRVLTLRLSSNDSAKCSAVHRLNPTPRSNTRQSRSYSFSNGPPGPSEKARGCSPVMVDAATPRAHTDSTGWWLRSVPGHVRKASQIAPRTVGVVRGSKIGRCSLASASQASDTRGPAHAAGSAQ